MDEKIIRYNPDGSVMAEVEWRGPGDYTVVNGALDEEGKAILDAVGDIYGYVEGYTNVNDAYEDRPYFGWPEEK
ncbi:hypothetical protein [Calidithermus roseus]|uniref:Uncharacterized protein n=1 Tax=Calidithermus roseus TaxID=1644118 RepID=A0A399EVU2_9DEIN|nr:hypothetical protein [Calidithermus roseus]RIH87793.1 hypothetical protein Mrose_01188 [Calidithermus roseus]